MVDGSYQSKIGQLVLGSADLVVWLDLPMGVWLPRLVSRTVRRARSGEELWAGNAIRSATPSSTRNSLILFTLRHFRARRRSYPERFADYDLVRLRTQTEIDRFLRSVEPRP